MKRIITFICILAMLSGLPAYAAELPDGVPGSLPAPTIANLELMKDEDGYPYFRAELTVPESVIELDTVRPADGWVDVEIYDTIDGEPYGGDGGGLEVFMQQEVPGKTNTYYINFALIDEGSMTETVINSRVYSYKTRFAYTYSWGEGPGEWDYIYSPWSNELSSKSESYYNGASVWAVPELDKAQEYGLITERIKGNMAGNITREEFAEIVVKLYEKYTGNIAEAGDMSFTDTVNPEILKAANLGLVLGVGNGKYAPDELVTREQMATILLRALKVINTSADFSTSGTAKFSDDSQIESWASDGVYYCFKSGIVTGVGNNMFNPDGNASREAAVIVTMRAYEFYK
jgi:hypothetical protein